MPIYFDYEKAADRYLHPLHRHAAEEFVLAVNGVNYFADKRAALDSYELRERDVDVDNVYWWAIIRRRLATLGAGQWRSFSRARRDGRTVSGSANIPLAVLLPPLDEVAAMKFDQREVERARRDLRQLVGLRVGMSRRKDLLDRFRGHSGRVG